MTQNSIFEFFTEMFVDLYISILCNKTGLINFIQTVLPDKAFKGAKIKALEVLFVLINNFPNKLANSLAEIIQLCASITYSFASAYEKDKAVTLLLLTLEKSHALGVPVENIEKCFVDIYSCWRRDASDTGKHNFCAQIIIPFTNFILILVQSKITAAVAAIIKYYPYVLENPSELTQKLVRQLEVEIKKKGRSLPIISESFIALADVLEDFPLDSSDSLYSVLYDCLKAMAVATDSRTFANRGKQ